MDTTGEPASHQQIRSFVHQLVDTTEHLTSELQACEQQIAAYRGRAEQLELQQDSKASAMRASLSSTKDKSPQRPGNSVKLERPLISSPPSRALPQHQPRLSMAVENHYSPNSLTTAHSIPPPVRQAVDKWNQHSSVGFGVAAFSQKLYQNYMQLMCLEAEHGRETVSEMWALLQQAGSSSLPANVGVADIPSTQLFRPEHALGRMSQTHLQQVPAADIHPGKTQQHALCENENAKSGNDQSSPTAAGIAAAVRQPKRKADNGSQAQLTPQSTEPETATLDDGTADERPAQRPVLVAERASLEGARQGDEQAKDQAEQDTAHQLSELLTELLAKAESAKTYGSCSVQASMQDVQKPPGRNHGDIRQRLASAQALAHNQLGEILKALEAPTGVSASAASEQVGNNHLDRHLPTKSDPRPGSTTGSETTTGSRQALHPTPLHLDVSDLAHSRSLLRKTAGPGTDLALLHPKQTGACPDLDKRLQAVRSAVNNDRNQAGPVRAPGSRPIGPTLKQERSPAPPQKYVSPLFCSRMQARLQAASRQEPTPHSQAPERLGQLMPSPRQQQRPKAILDSTPGQDMHVHAHADPCMRGDKGAPEIKRQLPSGTAMAAPQRAEGLFAGVSRIPDPCPAPRGARRSFEYPLSQQPQGQDFSGRQQRGPAPPPQPQQEVDERPSAHLRLSVPPAAISRGTFAQAIICAGPAKPLQQPRPPGSPAHVPPKVPPLRLSALQQPPPPAAARLQPWGARSARAHHESGSTAAAGRGVADPGVHGSPPRQNRKGSRTARGGGGGRDKGGRRRQFTLQAVSEGAWPMSCVAARQGGSVGNGGSAAGRQGLQ